MKSYLKQKSSNVNTLLIIWPRAMSVLEDTMLFSNSINVVYQTIIHLICSMENDKEISIYKWGLSTSVFRCLCILIIQNLHKDYRV